MAKLKVFSVYDSKVQAYARPFFMRTVGEALRGWGDVANDESTDICRHPHDYCLMELADFDEVSGVFTNLQVPYSHGLAVEAKRLDGSPEAVASLVERAKASGSTSQTVQ